MEGSCLSCYYYRNVTCDHCELSLPQENKIAFSRTKRLKNGFWCVACALDEHLITDKQVMRFLNQKQKPRVPRTRKQVGRY